MAAVLAMGLSASPAAPQSNVPLEVIGPDGQTSVMTRSEIEALPQSEILTTTIWTDGTIRFSGVPMARLLEHAGAEGTVLIMTALNDYSIEMPMGDLEADAPIVATRMNGQPMSVRDKGPYWVVYPFDDHPKYQTETTHARSVWQLARISVIE